MSDCEHDFLGYCGHHPHRCADCPRTNSTWSPVFAAWLCPECRLHRTDKLLTADRRVEEIPVRDSDRMSTSHRPHP